MSKGETEKDIKVRDHCHITGLYRGAAHNSCNLNYQLTKKIVVIHNLRGYDSHLIVQELGKYSNDMDKPMGIIPNTMEKYMSIMFSNLVFIDSFQFMPQSLSRLVNNLKEIPITMKEFGMRCPPPLDFCWLVDSHKLSEEDLQLNVMQSRLKGKGIYPYEYMDSFERFKERHLPSKKDFYSSLYDEHITDEDYSHAWVMWDLFKCKNLGDYHDLYLKTDVLLLADVFDQFRKTCLNYYNLDPAHYFSTPGMSWDGMLKMTNVKLDLLTDVDMHLMIEKGMRGGISYIGHRYAKANNKYLSDYDPNKESSYIIYLDANNLYGWAMSQPLLTGNFKWVKRIPKDPDTYFIECDLEFHEDTTLYSEHPLAPERAVVQDEWLSDYQKDLKKKFNISSDKIPKLLCTLRNKEKYVVHGRLLDLYLNLGMKVKKVHRILKFDSSPWLKEYIDFNTTKRAEAKNDFEKDFFKLINNSVYGKAMENLRYRENIKLYTNYDKFIKEASRPTFVNGKKM